MSLRLKDYIKNKFIENSFLEKFRGIKNKETNMYIHVGETFGFGEKKPYVSSYYGGREIAGVSFYKLDTKNGSKEMGYIDYSRKNGVYDKSIYVDIDGNLVFYNHTSKVTSPATIDDIPTIEKKELYQGYVDYLSKLNKPTDKVEYFFIGMEGSNKVFHGNDDNIYISNGDKKTLIDKGSDVYTKYMGIWGLLQQTL